MEILVIKTSDISPNSGQVKGLPKNPKKIQDSRYENLKTSISKYPEMLELREIVVIKHKKGYVAVCGNQRLKACMELGISEMFCKVLPNDTSPEKLRVYALVDNQIYGENDISIIASEWQEFLKDFDGLGLDNITLPSVENIEDISEYLNTVSEDVDNMNGRAKKSLLIEFEQEDYEEAFRLTKRFREEGVYIGGVLLTALKGK